MEHRAGAVGLEGRWTNSQFSPLNAYFPFRLSGSQSWFLLIHFCYGPKPPVHTTLHYTTLWCDTEPIRYATLHFRDLRRAASLRNRAEITVFICEQKLYPVEFSCRRKSHAVYCEHNLKLISPSSSITGCLKDNEYPSLTLQDRTH